MIKITITIKTWFRLSRVRRGGSFFRLGFGVKVRRLGEIEELDVSALPERHVAPHCVRNLQEFPITDRCYIVKTSGQNDPGRRVESLAILDL